MLSKINRHKITQSIFFFLIIIYSNCFSQRICEYGDYNFVLNIINGIDFVKYSKVHFINKESQKNISKYEYDNLGRLVKANFYGEAEQLNESAETRYCGGANLITYKYNKKALPNILNITENELTEQAFLLYNKNNDITSIEYQNLKIDYTYNGNNVKSIKRGTNLYEYFWNNNSLIEKMIISSFGGSTKQEIKFYYLNNKLDEITYLRTMNGYCLRTKRYNYIYENNLLCQIKREINRPENVYYYDYNYDYDDKVVVTIKNKNKEYHSHYDCYY